MEEIASLGVSHMTVTVNAVDPVIGAAIYCSVQGEHGPLSGVEPGEAFDVLPYVQAAGEYLEKQGLYRISGETIAYLAMHIHYVNTIKE